MDDELERLYELLYLLPVGVVAYGRDGSVTAVNPLAVQILNPFVAPTDSTSAPRLLAPLVDDPAVLAADRPAGEPLRARRSLRRPDGELVAIDLAVHQPRPGMFVAVLNDVTELVRRESELRRERDRMRVIVDVVQHYAIFTVDRTGRIDTWNASGERLFGLTEDDVTGRPLGELLDLAADGVDDLLQVAIGVGWNQVEGWTGGAEGATFYADTMVSTLVDAAGRPDGFAVITRDATEVHEREHRLRAETVTDPLTGLLNRRGVEARTEQLVEACRMSGAALTVLMLDIDHFKQVNDTHGHDVGDVVLRAVADRLTDGLRSTDVVGRLGGEEFVVLLPGADAHAATRMAEGLRAAIAEDPVSAGPSGPLIPVTVSIGVAECHQDPASALRRADEALYAAKQSGRNRVTTAGF